MNIVLVTVVKQFALLAQWLRVQASHPLTKIIIKLRRARSGPRQAKINVRAACRKDKL